MEFAVWTDRTSTLNMTVVSKEKLRCTLAEDYTGSQNQNYAAFWLVGCTFSYSEILPWDTE